MSLNEQTGKLGHTLIIESHACRVLKEHWGKGER